MQQIKTCQYSNFVHKFNNLLKEWSKDVNCLINVVRGLSKHAGDNMETSGGLFVIKMASSIN